MTSKEEQSKEWDFFCFFLFGTDEQREKELADAAFGC